jgi:hypothetical protein
MFTTFSCNSKELCMPWQAMTGKIIGIKSICDRWNPFQRGVKDHARQQIVNAA